MLKMLKNTFFKEQKIVKENRESIKKIFKNILCFDMKISNFINYSIDMCWNHRSQNLDLKNKNKISVVNTVPSNEWIWLDVYYHFVNIAIIVFWISNEDEVRRRHNQRFEKKNP
jgi:hypothetical protein